jgi:hypothetical protein
MKKSELKRIIQEELKGYSKYAPGGETKGGTTDDFRNILTTIAKGEDKEPIKEGEGKLYSKEEAIGYIENNPPVKYYRIGVSKGTSQTLQDAEKAIEVVKQSPINQFELSAQGNVIAFNAPFDQKHADLVRSMGSLD